MIQLRPLVERMTYLINESRGCHYLVHTIKQLSKEGQCFHRRPAEMWSSVWAKEAYDRLVKGLASEDESLSWGRERCEGHNTSEGNAFGACAIWCSQKLSKKQDESLGSVRGYTFAYSYI